MAEERPRKAMKQLLGSVIAQISLATVSVAGQLPSGCGGSGAHGGAAPQMGQQR